MKAFDYKKLDGEILRNKCLVVSIIGHEIHILSFHLQATNKARNAKMKLIDH
jgi:hypothetical protein